MISLNALPSIDRASINSIIVDSLIVYDLSQLDQWINCYYQLVSISFRWKSNQKFWREIDPSTSIIRVEMERRMLISISSKEYLGNIWTFSKMYCLYDLRDTVLSTKMEYFSQIHLFLSLFQLEDKSKIIFFPKKRSYN